MTLFDLLLGLGVCISAWLALITRELFRAVVMFIVFGLCMSLVWVRLKAPDIALAEAAIGAGITGVLLLDTLGYLRRSYAKPSTTPLDGATPAPAPYECAENPSEHSTAPGFEQRASRGNPAEEAK